MLLASKPLGHFIDHNPTIKMLALAFIVLVGVYLIADGFELHIPKGYIYGAMGFSALVECLNLWAKRRAQRACSRITRRRRAASGRPAGGRSIAPHRRPAGVAIAGVHCVTPDAVGANAPMSRKEFPP